MPVSDPHAETEGDDAFVLRNASPIREPEKFDTPKAKQRDLFIGLNDLPGQMYLIDDVNTD